jgi:hypothetical protein
MKRLGFLFILVCLFFIETISQSPPIGAMRPLDDNHALAADSTDWKLHRVIKEITLHKGNSGAMLSFGGEIREQFRYFNHVNFGDVGSGISDRDIYIQHRFLLHADLRINKYLRFFAQFNSCHATGKNAIAHKVDRDDLGIIQAFIDLNFHAPINMQLRFGRQEFSYGMERILALRDGPTIRQNFDGVRLTLAPGKLSGDFIFVQPVLYNVGIFDNTRRKKEYILGSYWSIPLNGKYLLDVYYFNAGFQNTCFANDTANENRHYVGFRLNKSSVAFSYDFEFTCQFGAHGTSRIRAWEVSSQYAYRWVNLTWQPRIVFREAVFSGDKSSSDGEINTFRPVSAKPPVHDLVPIGPSNIILLSPETELVLSKSLRITLRYIYVRRLSVNDGMYPSDMRKMSREKDEPGNDLGRLITTGVTADLTYDVNKHINLLVFGGMFKAGSYIRNTGKGRNIEAFSLRATYKF